MFKIDLSPSYWWPVRFNLPKETGGTQETYTFDVEYKRMTLSESEALGRRAEVEKLSDAAIAAEMVIGWKGVADGTGAPVPFSEAALRRALDTPNVAAAVVSTFFESNARASSKN